MDLPGGNVCLNKNLSALNYENHSFKLTMFFVQGIHRNLTWCKKASSAPLSYRNKLDMLFLFPLYVINSYGLYTLLSTITHLPTKRVLIG